MIALSKGHLFSFIFISVLSLFAQAQIVLQISSVVVNQKTTLSRNETEKSYTLQNAAAPRTEYEILIQNGNGLDYQIKNCTGHFIQRGLCQIENAATQLFLKFDRPKELEVRLNNVEILNRENFPIQKGQYVFRRFLTGKQVLSIEAEGLRTASFTVIVKKFEAPNMLPLANYNFTMVNNIEPSFVSFSGLLSSDPDGVIVNYSWDFGDQVFAAGAIVNHTYQAAGTYIVKLTVTDNRGGQSQISKNVVILPDIYGPILSQINPASNAIILNNNFILSGLSDEPLSKVTIKVNNEPEQIASINVNSFSIALSFSQHGAKTILVTAYDLKNNPTTLNLIYNVNYNNVPIAQIGLLSQSSAIVPSMIWFDGTQSSDLDNDPLTYAWDFGDSEISSEAKPTHLFKLAGSYSVKLTVTDTFGAANSITKNILLENPVLPLPPENLAPPLTQDLTQTNVDKFSFIYLGVDAVQKNVDVTKIEEPRITPIRGKVLKDSTTALSGVKVFIKDHAELGYTTSRDDGQWDLIVNGGGDLIVQYEKVGFASAQRQLDTENNISRNMEPIILVAVDDKKTVIQLSSATPQIHEASVVQDGDGLRRAQVMIPENTTASVIMPDGTRKNLEQITVRATEFTVGDDGPKKMPAELPPRSGYTYAADFTADEAIALGGSGIEFSKPVPIYVDNFLNIPVGMAVPVGYFNPKSGFWEQMDDGVVLKVLSIDANQKAHLDFAGLDAEATSSDLTMLNITDSELSIIAQKFTSGQSFWRAQSKHFSIIDLNLSLLSPDFKNTPIFRINPACGCQEQIGCIINVQNQLLKENISLKNLGFDLSYSSQRVPGRLAESTIEMNPIDEQFLNSSYVLPLFKVIAKVEVAGKIFYQEYNTPNVNDRLAYVWDGYDIYGRPVYGSQNAKVTIEYYYPFKYIALPYVEGLNTFDTSNPNLTATYLPGRNYFNLVYTLNKTIKSPFDIYKNSPTQQVGGWAISNYHTYDPFTKTLYKGSGEEVQTNTITSVVSTIAGTGASGSAGDHGLAKYATMTDPNGITRDVRGVIYFADGGAHNIRKIDKNGIISLVAGNGLSGYDGDGGLATEASIGSPSSVRTKEDGTIIFSDPLNNVVRKITPDGIISTIAGTGVAGYSGDGGLGTLAKLRGPRAIVLAKDGSLYISDMDNNRIRRLWTDGKITTYAGTGVAGFSGDNGPASEAKLNRPNFTDIDRLGNIYIADVANRRIRKISASGIITTIAGNGIVNGASADYQLATDIALSQPNVVRVNDRGEIFFTDQGANKLRKINQSQIVTTLIGSGVAGFNGDGKIGTETQISIPRSFMLDDEESIVFVDSGNRRIRRLGNSLASSFPAKIPSADGSEIYFFNEKGYHESTQFADTGANKFIFNHDAKNQVISVTDSYNNTTLIQRDSQGNAISMTGAFGQAYQFSYDQNNYLSDVTDPIGNNINIQYTTKGLMTTYRKPEGNLSSYIYDQQGRLTKATEPNGGYKILTRLSDYTVKYETSENIVSSLSTGQQTTDSNSYVFTEVGADGGQFSFFDGSKSGITYTRTPEGIDYNNHSSSDARFPGFVTYNSRSETIYKNFYYANVAQTNSRSYDFRPDGVSFIRTDVTADSSGQTMQTTYSNIDYSLNTISTTGQKTASFFNSQEKLISTKFGDNFLPQFFTYDTQGRITQIQQGDRITKMTYDQFGYLSQVTNPENQVTTFINDAIGRVLKTISPDAEETKIDYDKNSNIVGITPPQKLLHQFVVSAMDMIASYKSPGSGAAKLFNYDSDNRLRSIATEENTPITYNYGNVNGQPNSNKITSAITAQLGINYTYSAENKSVNSANSTDQINVGYNRASSLLFSKNYSGVLNASINYEYDYYSIMPIQENINGQVTYINYDLDKKITNIDQLVITRDPSTSLPIRKNIGATQENISYSSYGELSSREYVSYTAYPPAINLYKETYQRDKLGRIINKSSVVNNTTTSLDYDYDLKGRLKTAKLNGAVRVAVSYDAQGNRTQMKNGAGVVFYSANYDEKDRIISYIRSNEQINMTYSADDSFVKKQNTATSTQTSYYISPMNPLQKVEIVTPTQTKTITYLTDGELKRSAKLVNGIIKNYYLYDKQGRLVAELNPDQTLKSRFIYDANNHSPDLMIDIASGERYNFIKDQLGSILSVLTQNNQSKQQLRYDVFGAVTQDTNPGFQPFGFAGGHYDFETGLVRFGARDYDADTARWLVRDPIRFQGGDTNLYGYCGDDFVNCIDPSGLFAPAIPLIPVIAPIVVDTLIGVGSAIGIGIGIGTVCRDKAPTPPKSDPAICKKAYDSARAGCATILIETVRTQCFVNAAESYKSCIRSL